MKVTRELIIDAIKGINPSYNAMEHPLCKQHGVFSGSYGRWDWNYLAFKDCKLSDEDLYDFYKFLKETD